MASERIPLEDCARLRAAQRELESSRGSDLRVVVRWSGTEPKLRLMVEAREPALVDAALGVLEAAARKDLQPS
jgi:phosphoglucosamine mutase